MANTINLITKYSAENLDQIFMDNAVTAVLEGNNSLLKFINAKTVMIPTITMSGLGNYTREGNYPRGDVNVEWEPYTLKMDRARQFSVDAMNDEETAGIAFGALSDEFLRSKVVPEVDAYRLSTLYGLTPAENIKTATIAANTIIDTFNLEFRGFRDDEVGLDEIIGFISNEVDYLIKSTSELNKVITQTDYNNGSITFKVKAYDNVPLFTVPTPRFKTEYTFGDDGFAPTAEAKDMNYMFVHRKSALPVKKHNPMRVILPENNKDSDSYLLNYRLYHDIFTPKNKTKGLRVSVKG